LIDRQIWGEQKWLSPCTKPASEAEILVPTIVKLSNRCQSDQNHLVSTNISGAKKWCQLILLLAKKLVSTNIAAGAKNMNLPLKIMNLPVAAKNA